MNIHHWYSPFTRLYIHQNILQLFSKNSTTKSDKKIPSLLVFYFSISLVTAQYEIKPEKGYTPQIGIMVATESYTRVETLEERSWTDEEVNNHWAWFHVLEHSANHMGQIALVKSRLPE